MIKSDCEFVIVRVLDNYILYRNATHVASAKHVQTLVSLATSTENPTTMEIRCG